MAVFTPVSVEEAAAFTAPLKLGKLTSLRGIPDGIENTNYFVTTHAGEFVLTLFRAAERRRIVVLSATDVAPGPKGNSRTEAKGG